MSPLVVVLEGHLRCCGPNSVWPLARPLPCPLSLSPTLLHPWTRPVDLWQTRQVWLLACSQIYELRSAWPFLLSAAGLRGPEKASREMQDTFSPATRSHHKGCPLTSQVCGKESATEPGLAYPHSPKGIEAKGGYGQRRDSLSACVRYPSPNVLSFLLTCWGGAGEVAQWEGVCPSRG